MLPCVKMHAMSYVRMHTLSCVRVHAMSYAKMHALSCMNMDYSVSLSLSLDKREQPLTSGDIHLNLAGVKDVPNKHVQVRCYRGLCPPFQAQYAHRVSLLPRAIDPRGPDDTCAQLHKYRRTSEQGRACSSEYAAQIQAHQ